VLRFHHFLTNDTERSPWHCGQPLLVDVFSTIFAFAVLITIQRVQGLQRRDQIARFEKLVERLRKEKDTSQR
jgi:hypothetical protein